MLIVGLTGGIGSGKSTVAAMFEAHGVNVVDADVVAREVVEPGSAVHRQLIDLFGDGLVASDGTLDRHALRERVFANQSERRQLEAILHPAIRERTREALLEIAQRGVPYCINVVPLLLETGLASAYDRVLVIDTTPELQLERSVDRDGSDVATIRRIMDAQVAREERLAAADDVIHNTASAAQLQTEVERLHRLYTELGAGGATRAHL